MVNPMKVQVITALTSAGLPVEALGNAGFYLVEVSDARVRAALDTLDNFDACCNRLSKAAELGMLALDAAHPMEITTDVQARFSELEARFRGLISSLESSVKEALQLNFQGELDRVFKAGGTLEQRVRALISSEGALAQTLREKGLELSSLFDPSNRASFVARFESLLSGHLSANGSLAKLLSPEHKGSYADHLNTILEEYFGTEAGKIKQLLDPDVSSSPFGKMKGEIESRQHIVNQQFAKLVADTKAEFTRQFEGLKTDLLALHARVDGQVQAFEERAKRLEEAEQHAKELETEKRKQSFYAGNSFEERIVNFLVQFAHPRQDSPSYTGNIAGIDGKVGDIVYKLNLDGEWGQSADIALEVRNRECSRTGKSAFFLDELEAAKLNRQCQFGIMVCCLEKNADNGKPRFPIIQSHPGNRFTVLVDEEVMVPFALEAVLHRIEYLVRSKAEAERQEIDTQRIHDAVAKALLVVGKFRALKRNLTTSINTLDTIRQSIDEMEKEVEKALREAQNEVKKALQEQIEPMAEVMMVT